MQMSHEERRLSLFTCTACSEAITHAVWYARLQGAPTQEGGAHANKRCGGNKLGGY